MPRRLFGSFSKRASQRQMPDAPALTLSTLGSSRLLGPDGKEVTEVLVQGKRFALLAYLALARPRGFHRRDTLLALFWPELDARRARNSLSQSLSFLRTRLPEDIVQTRGTEEVGLDHARIRTGVEAFEAALDEARWADALEAYEGEFLRGLHVTDAGGFEEWMAQERVRLRDAAARAAWSLAAQRLGRGTLVEAEAAALSALELGDTNEAPVRWFLRRLCEAGDRAGAVAFFERFRDRLWINLELEPSEETWSLVEAIRNGDLSRDREFDGTPPGAGEGDAKEVTAPGSTSRPEPASEVMTGLGGLKRPASWIAFGVAAASLATVALWPGGPRRPDPSVVAVAPFANRTGRPSLEALAAGVAMNLQESLVRAGIGDVVPPSRVEQAILDAPRGPGLVPVLSQAVGAGVVITGYLVDRGDSLLVRVQCIDSGTGEDLCPIGPVGEPIQNDVALVAEVRERVSAVLAQHFDTVLALEPELAAPPEKLEAYREFQRGWMAYRDGGTHQDAIAHFRKAWELDRGYLSPPLWILTLYSVRPGLHSPQVRGDVDSLLERVDASRSRMTPYQSRYFRGMRHLAEGEPEEAYQEFLGMAEISRMRAAVVLAESAWLTNRPEKAVEAAGWLDRGNGEFPEPYVAYLPRYLSLYVHALHLTGRYEKELEIARTWGRQLPPTAHHPNQAETKARVGLGQLDRLNGVVDAWRREGRVQAIWDLSDELRIHGHEDAARTLLEEEVGRFDEDGAYLGRFNNQAMVLHRLGRNREAHALWRTGTDLDRPDPWPWGVARIGFSAALIGDSAQARAMERLLLAIPGPREGDYTPFLQAKIAAALGEKDRAVHLLAEWARKGTVPSWPANVHRDFTLQSLLADYPPFQELMRPKG